VDIPYRVLADVVLATHFGIVLFVVGGLPLIVLGNVRGWAFVTGWWFRLAHVAAIAVVAGQAWLGIVCPLTTLESWLRAKAGQATYAGSFIEHWLTRILFYEAPLWVFTAAYTLFALAVAAAWWQFPPRRRP
jgi:polyferredoxin